MTEIEYVQAISDAAKAYRKLFENGKTPAYNDPAVMKWDSMKAHLSPSTAIAMAEAWLKLQDAAD